MAEDSIWDRKPHLKLVKGGSDEKVPDGSTIKRWREPWEENELPLRPWLVPGFLMRGAVACMSGAGGSGKSLLATGLAVAGALGLPYGSFKPARRMKVAYYNTEDDDLEQRKRISAVLRQFGKSPADLYGYLERIEPTDDPELLRWVNAGDDGWGIVETATWADLKNAIADFRPDFCIFDPLAELNGAPENDNSAQRKVMSHFRRLSREFDIASLLVDHSAKGTEADAGKAAMQRGASSKANAARLTLTCTVMTVDEAKILGLSTEQRHLNGFLRLVGAKANYSRSGGSDWYEKMEYELANGEMTPAAVPWTPPEDAAAKLDLYVELVEAIAAGIGGQPYSPKLTMSEKEPRSIRRLFQRFGIKGLKAEAAALLQLKGMGVEEVIFKNPDRNERWGFRTRENLPKAEWAPAQAHQSRINDPIDVHQSLGENASMDAGDLDWSFPDADQDEDASMGGIDAED